MRPIAAVYPWAGRFPGQSPVSATSQRALLIHVKRPAAARCVGDRVGAGPPVCVRWGPGCRVSANVAPRMGTLLRSAWFSPWVVCDLPITHPSERLVKLIITMSPIGFTDQYAQQKTLCGKRLAV